MQVFFFVTVKKDKSLYGLFLESLQDLLGTRPHDDFIEDPPPAFSMYPEQIDRQMKMKGVFDPLLKINFLNLFHSCNVRLQGSIDEEDQDSKWGLVYFLCLELHHCNHF